MKLLFDAQLPRRLAYRLRESGHDAVHTLDLPQGNRTSDADINDISMRENRIVVTKDSDFVDSFIILQRPYKLLLISTGNITNAELESLFAGQISRLDEGFESHDYVELRRETLVFHS